MTRATKLGIVILGVFAIGLALLVIILSSFVCVIPPQSRTITLMEVLRRRVMLYAKLHDRLPGSLNELPPLPGYVNAIVDAWGREIVYKINQDGAVVLASYGKDGREGGDGQNRDMIGIFPTKKKDGRWEDDSCAWIKDPWFDVHMDHPPRVGGSP